MHSSGTRVIFGLAVVTSARKGPHILLLCCMAGMSIVLPDTPLDTAKAGSDTGVFALHRQYVAEQTALSKQYCSERYSLLLQVHEV